MRFFVVREGWGIKYLFLLSYLKPRIFVFHQYFLGKTAFLWNFHLNNELKKVLYVPTGAIFSPTMVFQKETIPSIAHAVSLEVIS